VYNRGYVCKTVNVLQQMQCTKHRQISSLMTRTKTFLETSVYSPFNHLMRPLAQKYFLKFGCPESLKLYITLMLHVMQQTDTLMLNIHTVHLDITKVFFYSPTDAQVNCLKTILKFTLKLTLEQLQHVSVQSSSSSSGSILLMSAKVTVTSEQCNVHTSTRTH
jgi:hypothetical protein